MERWGGRGRRGWGSCIEVARVEREAIQLLRDLCEDSERGISRVLSEAFVAFDDESCENSGKKTSLLLKINSTTEIASE